VAKCDWFGRRLLWLLICLLFELNWCTNKFFHAFWKYERTFGPTY
jgi:hypothetical protein